MNTDSVPVRGLILDAVGTLIEPEPSVAEVYAATARRQGIVVETSEIKARFHRFFRVDEDDERLGPLGTDEETERRRWRRIVSNVLPDLPDPDRGFLALWDHFGDPSAWRTFGEVGPFLDAIRSRGLRFVIASNFDGRLRRVVEGLPALRNCVDRLVISSEIGVRKPHPGFYRAACERMDLPAESVVCLGDDVENDVLGPIRAGLRGLLVDRDGRSRSDVAAWPSLDAALGSVFAGVLA